MSDVITEYQKWKQQGDDLRLKAKQAMESRFRDLLVEAVRIAEEYKTDFGAVLKPANPVTSFRYKPLGKAKAKKAAGKAPVPVAAAPVKTNPKIAGLQKRLGTLAKKMEQAKAAGTTTRALEDKIYEVEDELRLATTH